MALYLQAGLTWKLSKTSTQAQFLSNRSITLTEAVDIEEDDGVYFKLADAASDVSISFDVVTTAKALLIESDRAITVKINGSATGLPIGHTADEGGTLLLTATAVTSLSFSNASGDIAYVYISMPGV